MLTKSNSIKNAIMVGIVIGAVFGGIIGAIINSFIGWGLLIGATIGGLIGWYAAEPKVVRDELEDTQNSTDERSIHSNEPYVTLKLREEQLEIIKNKVPTAEVSYRTEVVTEEKNFTVPITREELIIEKTILDNDVPHGTEPVTETIRIPIREERVEIIKQAVILEDVSVERQQFQTTETVSASVKKEKLNIEKTGDPKVIIKDE